MHVSDRMVQGVIVTNLGQSHSCLQQEGEGTSGMAVEKQKLDNLVKDLKGRVQVGRVAFFLSVFAQVSRFTSTTGSTTWGSKALCQVADQSIKILEDQQDEYNFKINTLKNRGAETNSTQHFSPFRPPVWNGVSPAENEMNGMTQKELEQEKLTLQRNCLELKSKRQVSPHRTFFLLFSMTAGAFEPLEQTCFAPLLHHARMWCCSCQSSWPSSRPSSPT